MTTNLHPRVLELISSRICHDLVSPVGAINNGAELIAEMGADAGDEAMKLIANSAQQASYRLKAFRLCYGAAGTDKNIGFKDIRETFTDLIGAGRIKTEFDDTIGVKFSMPPHGFFKCVLNLLILAEECAHGEGQISVRVLDGNKGLQILVTGKNPGFRGTAKAALDGESDPTDLDPRSVHAYITGQFISWFGFTLTYDDADPDHGRLEFNLTF